MMDDIEQQLREAERQEPHRQLRARVLAAAAPLVRPDASRLERMWFSRTWRVAAVLAFFALAGLESASSQLVAPPAWGPSRQSDLAQTIESAALEVGLTPADVSALLARTRAAPPALTLDEATNGIFSPRREEPAGAIR